MDTQRTTDDDWESQLTDYVFGAMAPEAAQQFERGLSQCREKVLLAQQYSEVMGLLGAAVSPAEPPQGHKTRLMARIASMPQERADATLEPLVATTSTVVQMPVAPIKPATTPTQSTPPIQAEGMSNVTDLSAYRERRRAGSVVPWAMAAAATLLFLVGAWGWLSAQSVAEQRARELADLRSTVATLRDTPNIPPGYLAFPVQGQQAMRDATAVVLFDPNKNEAFLLAQGLKPLTSAEVYELWLLPQAADQAPVPAGTFNADDSGRARHTVEASANIGTYAGVAVTLEPAPGVPSPTGPMVLVGKYALP